MDRLTEKQSAGYDLKALNGQYCNNYCDEQSAVTCRNCAIYQAIQKLAHYEDMEEQGKLLILPCKPGDTVWIIYQTIVDKLIGEYSILKGFIQELAIENSNNLRIKVDTTYGVMCFDKYDMGKTVFLTEQEAKEALEGMKK